MNKEEEVQERIKEIREEMFEELGIDKFFIVEGILRTIMDPKCAHQTKVHALLELGDRLGVLPKADNKVPLHSKKEDEEKTIEEIEQEIKEIEGMLENEK